MLEKLLIKLNLSDDDSFAVSILLAEYFYNIRLQTEYAIRANAKPENQQRDVEATLPIQRLLMAYENNKKR